MHRSAILQRLHKTTAALGRTYAKIFSLSEIREQPILQWYFGGSLLFFFLSFSTWVDSTKLTVESAEEGLSMCWPYAQECTRLFFLHALDVDYSRPAFYMALYATMALIVWCMWRAHWSLAHALTTILFIWEALVALFFNYSMTAPYYYYHLLLTATLLFLPSKEYFLKILFVLLYFLSATVKFDSAWIAGTYFTSLKNGLPLIPDALAPLVTNLVILSQVAGCWFLLSSRQWAQRSAVVFFTFFHLYSGIFVSYVYPTTALAPLLILFGPLYRYTPIPISRKAAAGWCLIAVVCVVQILGFLPTGNRNLTLEGNRFGMFMFESNHQCVITATTYSYRSNTPDAHWEAPPLRPCGKLYCLVMTDQTTDVGISVYTERYESSHAMYRCDPYEWWTRYTTTCKKNPLIQRVALTFDHSINGGPFYRIVDTDNICDLEYRPFVHNEWIQSPPEAPAIGRPVENAYK